MYAIQCNKNRKTIWMHCISKLSIYAQVWFVMKNKWKFKLNSHTEELNWCKRNLISLIGINQVAEMVKELTARLARLNIRPLRKLIHRYVGQGMKPALFSSQPACPCNTILVIDFH